MSHSTFFACLSIDAITSLDKAVRILPMGRFAPNDGRSLSVSEWVLTEARAHEIANYWRNKPEQLCIDYHHQTQWASQNGKPAPAAGWSDGQSIEVRSDGMYLTIEWTEAARAAIKAKEFKYLSPTFAYDSETGEVLMLLMAGLTNTPGLTGLTELDPAMLSQFLIKPTETKGNDVDEKTLKLLGLGKDAKPEEIDAAVAKLHQEKTEADAKVATLTAEVDTQKAAVATLQAQQVSTGGDASADKAAIAALTAQVATLTQTQNAREVNDLVTAALADGRLMPVTEKWARELGAKDLAQLQAFLDAQPKIAALTGTQTGGAAPNVPEGAEGLTAEDLAVCSQMGFDPVEFAKTKSSMAV